MRFCDGAGRASTTCVVVACALFTGVLHNFFTALMMKMQDMLLRAVRRSGPRA